MSSLVLSWFFDDYGILKYEVIIFTFFVYCCLLFLLDYLSDNEVLSRILVLISISFGIYIVYKVHSMNPPYEYISLYGSDSQKNNLKKCIVGKEVSSDNIRSVMKACRFQTNIKIES